MLGVIGEALNKNLHPVQSYKMDADNFVDYFNSVGETVAESFKVTGSHDDITNDLSLNENFICWSFIVLGPLCYKLITIVKCYLETGLSCIVY